MTKPKDLLEQRICRAINSVPEPIKPNVGDKTWTKAVFNALSVLGKELGYSICSSASDGEYYSGWLYDLIWYRNNDDGQLAELF